MDDKVLESGQILGTDKFFLLVNSSGFFIKTRFKKDFDEILGWDIGDILFASEVKNSQTLFFQVGSSISNKKISLLPVAQTQEKTIWFDISELEIKNNSHINKCWVGGKAENYEKL